MQSHKSPPDHRQRVVKTPRNHKIAVMSRNSSSLRNDILSISPPSTRLKNFQGVTSGPSRSLSTDTAMTSRPVPTESRMETKPILTGSSSTVSKDQLILSSKSKISLPVQQIWNSSLLTSATSQSRSKDLTSLISSRSNVRSTLIPDLPSTGPEIGVDQISKERNHTNCNGMTHHHGNTSRPSHQLGELQKWITEL